MSEKSAQIKDRGACELLIISEIRAIDWLTLLYSPLYKVILRNELPAEDPVYPTPPTMYHQQPKWLKSAFGKSLIISHNQPKSGRRREHSRIELQKNKSQCHMYIIK